MRNVKSLLLLLVVPLALSGCASKVAAIKVDAPLNTMPSQGYLLVGLDTDLNLNKLIINGRKSVEFTKQDLKIGSDYLMTSLPAGKYYFHSIAFKKIYDRSYLDLDEKALGFEIKAGQINYVGDIELRGKAWSRYYNFYLVNRASVALEFMQDHFPTLLQSQTIDYTGPGEDNFFQVISDKSYTQRPAYSR